MRRARVDPSAQRLPALRQVIYRVIRNTIRRRAITTPTLAVTTPSPRSHAIPTPGSPSVGRTTVAPASVMIVVSAAAAMIGATRFSIRTRVKYTLFTTTNGAARTSHRRSSKPAAAHALPKIPRPQIPDDPHDVVPESEPEERAKDIDAKWGLRPVAGAEPRKEHEAREDRGDESGGEKRE